MPRVKVCKECGYPGSPADPECVKCGADLSAVAAAFLPQAQIDEMRQGRGNASIIARNAASPAGSTFHGPVDPGAAAAPSLSPAAASRPGAAVPPAVSSGASATGAGAAPALAPSPAPAPAPVPSPAAAVSPAGSAPGVSPSPASGAPGAGEGGFSSRRCVRICPSCGTESPRTRSRCPSCGADIRHEEPVYLDGPAPAVALAPASGGAGAPAASATGAPAGGMNGPGAAPDRGSFRAAAPGAGPVPAAASSAPSASAFRDSVSSGSHPAPSPVSAPAPASPAQAPAPSMVSGTPGGTGAASGAAPAASPEDSRPPVSGAPVRMVKICPNCGSEMTDIAKRCTNCGEDLRTIRPTEAAVRQAPSRKRERKRQSQELAVFMSPDGREIFHVLASSPVTVIGREHDMSAYLESCEYVSRRHAEIKTYSSQIVINDVGSTNGTFVNDRKVESLKDQPLRDGDRISLGGTWNCQGAGCFTVKYIPQET